jgi:hypothetical protein
MCTTLDVAAPSVTTRRRTSSRFVGNATKIYTGPHFPTIDDHQFQQRSFVSLRWLWRTSGYGYGSAFSAAFVGGHERPLDCDLNLRNRH